MSDDGKKVDGPPAAPGGVTSGDDTTGGVDSASAASISAPAAHPGTAIEGNPEPLEDQEPVLPRALPDHDLLRGLIEPFDDAVWELSAGQDIVRIAPDRFAEFGTAARQAGFEVCVDVTAVDWFRQRRPRFDVVANLLSHRHVLRLRVIAGVDGDEPHIPSLTPIWPGANFAERETYDMYGIVFDGHPDLTRILMPDDWVGFPLRKDFAVGAVPVQFKDSHKVT
ncbi:MAG TPA: NADH-quinone oxidoreductase subunit C [Acidimicrobiia bacterium]|nr:NADH-quinone oxidoreductase subunit C [Acidimicrobiia bacterium]